jgi:hypothetical protein
VNRVLPPLTTDLPLSRTVPPQSLCRAMECPYDKCFPEKLQRGATLFWSLKEEEGLFIPDVVMFEQSRQGKVLIVNPIFGRLGN